jgi:hypothetical protein
MHFVILGSQITKTNNISAQKQQIFQNNKKLILKHVLRPKYVLEASALLTHFDHCIIAISESRLVCRRFLKLVLYAKLLAPTIYSTLG